MKRINDHVRLIEDGLRQMDLSGKPTELYDPIQYFMALGGKRLRPALCLLACELAGGDPRIAVVPAIGIEVFHNFSLVHDDIMDLAEVRRGQPTVHEKWNLNTAILSGDTMLVKAYQLLASVDSSVLKPVLDTFSKTAIEVCEGQQFDMSFETEDPVMVEDYIEMIRLKTSVLLGGALKIGALVGGAKDKTANQLYDFGVNAGIAFQIQDDLLDAFGNPEKVGKKPGGDILQNKQTLLRIHAWHNGGDQAKTLLKKQYTSDSQKVQSIKSYYESSGTKAYVEEKRNSYHKEALKCLSKVDGDAEIKQDLAEFSEWLIQREH